MKRCIKIAVVILCVVGITAMLCMEQPDGGINAWCAITAALSMISALLLCDKYIWDKNDK